MVQKRQTVFSLDNISIGRKLALLLIIPLVILMIVGFLATNAFNQSNQSLANLQAKVESVNGAGDLLDLINHDYKQTLNEINTGALTWQDGLERIDLAKNNILQQLKNHTSNQDLSRAKRELKQSFAESLRIIANENRGELDLFVANDLSPSLQPLVNILEKEKTADVKEANKNFKLAKEKASNTLKITTTTIIMGIILTAVLGYFIYKSIVKSTTRLSKVVNAITAGEYTLRTNLTSTDELGQLGSALDNLLDERLADLSMIEKETAQLNESVISLLMTVSVLSEKDLTARAMVTEDATGPVADALNLMTFETANVLSDVKKIASVVRKESGQVNNQAAQIRQAGEQQQQDIAYTAESLSNASNSLSNIATSALDANNLASVTAETTSNAAKTVENTSKSIGVIRQTIQETGKRIKRLSERTQEISGIVDVINGIAERTTVLALNASMQAAAAGDAGRGFAVVADEVQRLAESSRQATSQIETLIKNIVVETNETMSTMEKTIEQVVDGTKLAEQAGDEMKKTLDSTKDLVASVANISTKSQEQAVIAEQLLDRAENIKDQSQETGKRLTNQLEQTKKLASYAERLMSSVSVFKLPEAPKKS